MSAPKELLDTLPGAQQLAEEFGRLPDFHDAEVISLVLRRTGVSTLIIQPFPPDNPRVVEFTLVGLTDLELFDFSSQNVINSLSVERVTNTAAKQVFRLHLSPCYGLSGWIEAENISIKLHEGEEAGTQG